MSMFCMSLRSDRTCLPELTAVQLSVQWALWKLRVSFPNALDVAFGLLTITETQNWKRLEWSHLGEYWSVRGITFRNKLILFCRWHTQPSKWRTTLCRLHATAYSQVPSISRGGGCAQEELSSMQSVSWLRQVKGRSVLTHLRTDFSVQDLGFNFGWRWGSNIF